MEVSPTTSKAYADAMKRLRTFTKEPITNSEQIVKSCQASGYADSSMNVMYCAILKIHGHELTPEQQEPYKKAVKELKEKRNAVQDDQKMTEKQKEKFLSWDEVLKVREKIKDSLNDVNFSLNMDYLIVCLYTMFENRRLDYGDMRVVDEPEDCEDNLYIISTGQFVFAKYKTAKKYGKQTFTVPEELNTIIKKFVTKYKQTYLFMNRNGLPMGNKKLSDRIIRIFHRHTGKDVGACMLRHSKATEDHKGEKTLKEQNVVAFKSGHSVIENARYAFLNDLPEHTST